MKILFFIYASFALIYLMEETLCTQYVASLPQPAYTQNLAFFLAVYPVQCLSVGLSKKNQVFLFEEKDIERFIETLLF